MYVDKRSKIRKRGEKEREEASRKRGRKYARIVGVCIAGEL